MRIFTLLFLLLSLSNVNGAHKVAGDNGIYLTKEDFINDQLSFPSQRPYDKIKEERLGSIRLIREEGEHYFTFGTFYGYKNNGQKYLSFGKKAFLRLYGYYQIIDNSGLFVYLQRVPHPLHIYTEEPYFSASLDAKKYPLNIHQLRKRVHPSPELIHELRWFSKNTSSLAVLVNDRSIVNILLAKYDSHQMD